MSIFSRRSRRRSQPVQHLVSASAQPMVAAVQPAKASTPAWAPTPPAEGSVHRHGRCHVKHRTPAAAERCTKG